MVTNCPFSVLFPPPHTFPGAKQNCWVQRWGLFFILKSYNSSVDWDLQIIHVQKYSRVANSLLGVTVWSFSMVPASCLHDFFTSETVSSRSSIGEYQERLQLHVITSHWEKRAPSEVSKCLICSRFSVKGAAWALIPKPRTLACVSWGMFELRVIVFHKDGLQVDVGGWKTGEIILSPFKI